MNSKTNVVTNSNLFNLDNKFISFFLIEDSASLSCSSGIKTLKISTFYVFAYNLYNSVIVSLFLHYWLSTPPIWETLSACFIVLVNL